MLLSSRSVQRVYDPPADGSCFFHCIVKKLDLLKANSQNYNHLTLRVFLSIFDRTLTAHFLKTDDARANRFLLLKQLTLEVHDDTISDDNAPSSGSSELIKFKFQTLSTFATVIRF